jgi:RNA polymerase sigma-70 factor (ECF subfamily)
LLRSWSDGDEAALEALLPLIYDELRRLAHRHLYGERQGHTLATTDLVHEAFFNLVRQEQVEWQNRAHFLAIAAQAMRRVLLLYARSRRAQKRGGNPIRVPLDDALVVSEDNPEALLALDDALTRLEALDETLARVVEYRYFGGLTLEETAEAMGVSSRTVKRHWRTARAWLFGQLQS